MKRYMVIEHFAPGMKNKVYERFDQKGRMLPEGLTYIDSWLEKDGDRCFQLMETEDPSLFDCRWTPGRIGPVRSRRTWREASDQLTAKTLVATPCPFVSNGMKYAVASFLCLTLATSPFALGEVANESQRLERLERAVELLQQRNAELEAEVKSLKKDRRAKPPASLAEEKKSHFVPDSKSAVVEKTETTEEKKPVYVVPGASELKLTLGGFIQMQYEAGDVFAFEGRFGSTAIDDRFRLRRARINLTGDFAEDFDFKIEGEFEQSDVGLTIRDATGRTLGSNSTRTEFGATDIFINWHHFPEFQIKAGQYKAPFGLEQLSPDTKLFLAERSEVTSALTPERQVGVEIWGKPFTNVWPEQKDFVTYWAGMFNGNGRNFSVNDNDQYMFAGRIEVQALKAKIFNEDATVKFGANGLSSHDSPGTVLSPAGTLRVNSDGSLSTFTSPSAAKREGYGFDGSFHWGRFDLIGEYQIVR